MSHTFFWKAGGKNAALWSPPFLPGNISLAGCHSWLSRGVLAFGEVKNPAIFSTSSSKTKQNQKKTTPLSSLQDEKQPPQVGEVNKVTVPHPTGSSSVEGAD